LGHFIAVSVLAILASLTPANAQTYTERGVVRAQNRPVPGAIVTAERGTEKLSTSTGDDGSYELALPEGEWKITVEMFGFAPAVQTLHPGPTAPATQWTLALRPMPAPRPGRPAGPGANAPTQEPEPSDPSIADPLTAPPSFGAPGVEPSQGGSSSDAFLIAGSTAQGLPGLLLEGMPGGFGPGFPGSGMGGGIEGLAAGGQNSNIFGGGAADGAEAGAGGGRGGPGGGRGGGPGGGFGGGRGGPGGGPGGGRPGGFGGPGGPGGPGGRPGITPEMMERIRRARAQNTAIGNRRARRGRDMIRGMVSFQARNSAWNARPFSLTGLEYDKPDQSSYRLSSQIGGQLPKLGEGTNFAISYDFRKEKRAFNSVATVPTALERAGDFSQSRTTVPVQLFDPLSGLPFAGNQIPASRIGRAATGLMALIPLPNLAAGVQNYQFITGVPQNAQNMSVRLSRPLTRKDRFSSNVSWQKRDGETAQLFGFIDESDGYGWTADLGWSRNLAPNVIQNIRTRFTRNVTNMIPYFAGRTNVAAELGIQGASSDPVNWGPPNLNFTNFGALRDGVPSSRRDLQMNVSGGWNFVHGRHNVSTGVDATRFRMNLRTEQNARGTFTFSGLATSQLDAAGNPTANSGYDFADFLLGLPQSSSIRFGSSSNYYRAWNYTSFVQDDWKVRPNLSLSLGLRYELFGPMEERYGRIANLDIASGFTGVAVVLPGQSGPYGGLFPDALVDADKNNFSPRFGLAWKASDKKKITVRAGYGWYYNGSIYQNFAQRLASQPPFAQSGTVNSTASRRLTIENGFAVTPNQEITNTFAVDRSYLVGYAQTWNLNVVKEFGRAYVLDVGILGTKGTRLDMQRSPNRAAPGSQLNAEDRRRIGNAVGFTFDSAEGNSIFHAAQARVTRRFARGVSFNAFYTFGKSIDNASSIGGGGSNVAQDDTNLRAERGLSSFNATHSLSTSFVFQSPIRERSGGFWSALGRGWNVMGATTFRSGTPLTARVLGNQSDASGTGVIGSGRADASGLTLDNGDGFFNLAAFVLPPSGRYGNAGRNTITGPALFAINGSVGRGFRVGDNRRRLEFRVEANNLTNRVSITTLGTVVNASNYGLAQGAAAMRTIQAIARFRF